MNPMKWLHALLDAIAVFLDRHQPDIELRFLAKHHPPAGRRGGRSMMSG